MRGKIVLTILAMLFGPVAAQAQSSEAMFIVTYLEVKPASAAAGAALAKDYVRTTSKDAGNLRVDAYQEIDRTNRLVVVEAWKDQAAFSAHEKAAGTTAFRDKFKAIQVAPYDQRVTHGFSIDATQEDAGRNAVYVVTHVDVPGAMREAGEKLLQQLALSTRQDAGHVRFDVYQQVDPRTNHFTVFSAWKSRGAFDTHGSTAHAMQFREALGPLLGALYDERIYQLLKP